MKLWQDNVSYRKPLNLPDFPNKKNICAPDREALTVYFLKKSQILAFQVREL